MCELWKDIKGYEGLYQVSNLGRVKSLKKYHGKSLRKGAIIKQYLTRQNYCKVILSKDKINKNGELVKEWESIKEATEKLHLYGIGRACRGKLKSSGGYIWKYKEVK